MEDTPCYNRFNDVNVDLHHQDKEWLAWWQTFTSMDGEEGSPDGMKNEDPLKVQVPSTGIDREIPTLEQGDNYVGVSIMLGFI